MAHRTHANGEVDVLKLFFTMRTLVGIMKTSSKLRMAI